ncbi:S41 family peptidase [Winogradskyella sp. SYSU M77433]|uniref:S41 family peptidase n=1 Tax=Winogradskyella sp. SYSU M77433 TaxID=3042722 RepID=UPI002480E401|nr:S41 family peptidase [Winogradskyella sp. SYSU M77433]MDH7914184.1 S41 family peptidase [Winogradskyella sp. SYSU M77433]
MKKYINLLFAGVVLLSLSSCFDDMDDNITYSSTDVKDFVWKAMNAVYLYKSDIPDLANDRFSSNEEYSDYLATYETPEVLFEDLKYDPQNVDKFSRIYSNYYDLQNQLQGTSLSNGLEFNLYYVPGSDFEVFGVITLVLNNSAASNLGLQRGQIFRVVNGETLNETNYASLLNSTSYTLNFADYDNNGTEDTSDDTITLNGESADLTKVQYTENPVHTVETLTVDGTSIGYLLYNRFTSNYEDELNDAFGQLQAAGVTELVLDLRYNGGGSVQTAAYLGSMITGQFNGSIFSKLLFNENLSNNDTNYLFTNSIQGGGSINSLNLSKLYVLTTNRRTASASEMIINSLEAYIDVVVIGENTVGKSQASNTVFDSPSLFGTDNINPNHTYALQPLIYFTSNVNEEIVPSTGIVPDVEITESPSNLGILGDVNEPLLAAAIQDITLNGRPLNQSIETISSLRLIKSKLKPLEQDMYIE